MPTEQSPTDRILPQEPIAERGKEATTRTDSERAVAAVVRAIATEGHVTRVEAARQDRGKALREWITVFLLGLAIVLLALLMVGLYWQVREMIAVYGPIRDQAEAAKKSAEAATRLSEAADQSLLAVQRAWIAPRLAYFLAEPVAGKPVEMWIEYRNTGRNPADDVVGEFKALAIRPGDFDDGSETRSKMRAFAEQCQAYSQWSGGTVIYPTFESARSYLVGFKLPDDLVDKDVARGEKLILVQYCFRYRTFEIPRHSLVCYYYRKGVSVRNNLNLCEFEQKAN
jgi:Na+-transporting methylmalonyl-CoA/oxaloacetate decarboxylase gamma subunit